jgi:hypothetical protein
MGSGYVYILINPSMPGVVKVGCTLRDSRARARKLRTTGVPTPFEVAFEIFADDHEKVEQAMHAQLASFRVCNDREFFRYPLKDAINLLLQLEKQSRDPESSFVALSILRRLREQYPLWIDPEIVDVRLVQSDGHVWLEITRENMIAGYLRDQDIKRTDLAFIVDGVGDLERGYFGPDIAVTENARRFAEEFGPYCLGMTTDLFNDRGNREIDEKYNLNRKDTTDVK